MDWFAPGIRNYFDQNTDHTINIKNKSPELWEYIRAKFAECGIGYAPNGGWTAVKQGLMALNSLPAPMDGSPPPALQKLCEWLVSKEFCEIFDLFRSDVIDELTQILQMEGYSLECMKQGGVRIRNHAWLLKHLPNVHEVIQEYLPVTGRRPIYGNQSLDRPLSLVIKRFEEDTPSHASSIDLEAIVWKIFIKQNSLDGGILVPSEMKQLRIAYHHRSHAHTFSPYVEAYFNACEVSRSSGLDFYQALLEDPLIAKIAQTADWAKNRKLIQSIIRTTQSALIYVRSMYPMHTQFSVQRFNLLYEVVESSESEAMLRDHQKRLELFPPSGLNQEVLAIVQVNERAIAAKRGIKSKGHALLDVASKFNKLVAKRVPGYLRHLQAPDYCRLNGYFLHVVVMWESRYEWVEIIRAIAVCWNEARSVPYDIESIVAIDQTFLGFSQKEIYSHAQEGTGVLDVTDAKKIKIFEERIVAYVCQTPYFSRVKTLGEGIHFMHGRLHSSYGKKQRKLGASRAIYARDVLVPWLKKSEKSLGPVFEELAYRDHSYATDAKGSIFMTFYPAALEHLTSGALTSKRLFIPAGHYEYRVDLEGQFVLQMLALASRWSSQKKYTHPLLILIATRVALYRKELSSLEKQLAWRKNSLNKEQAICVPISEELLWVIKQVVAWLEQKRCGRHEILSRAEEVHRSALSYIKSVWLRQNNSLAFILGLRLPAIRVEPGFEKILKGEVSKWIKNLGRKKDLPSISKYLGKITTFNEELREKRTTIGVRLLLITEEIKTDVGDGKDILDGICKHWLSFGDKDASGKSRAINKRDVMLVGRECPAEIDRLVLYFSKSEFFVFEEKTLNVGESKQERASSSFFRGQKKFTGGRPPTKNKHQVEKDVEVSFPEKFSRLKTKWQKESSGKISRKK